MLGLPDYETIGLIYEGSKTLIYRVRHRESLHSRIVKTLRPEAGRTDAIRLRREYDIARGLELEGIVKPVELRESANVAYLISEDFGGESLHRLLQQRGRLEQTVFLDMAVQLARILGRLHRSKVVHKDIKPKNIIVHPDTYEARLTDFGIASLLVSESQDPVLPQLLEGTLTHMSPEQTGRISRVIDYRSDFYSLGVTFYEMLTGQIPFAETDSLGLIHAHIAKQPMPPRQLVSQVPQAVSDLVMKCLAKNAEDRYQSAFGLEADLERCRQELMEKGAITLFAVGERDRKDIFAVPQRLYGRDAEWNAIQAAYDRVACGAGECVLLAGAAGTGKSSLAMELKRVVVRDRGAFVFGKFDPFRRDVPYDGWTSALQMWVRQLLAEDEESLALWRSKLLHFVGVSGEVLTDLVPDLELVIGKQPPAEKMPATESRHRLHYMLRGLLKQLASRDHPLVLLLDDLQWADISSLELLRELVAEEPVESFLLAATYRVEEAADHPLLFRLVPELLQTASCSLLELGPLQSGDIAKLLGETMQCDLEHCRKLAGVVMEKTGGNPFFVRQFLEVMYDRGLVRFDYERESWIWEPDSLAEMNLSDHVIRLIEDKMEQLPPTARYLLQAAACVGFGFNVTHVAALTRMEERTALQLLRDAVRMQLIAPVGSGYKLAELSASSLLHTTSDPGERSAEFRFLHDRIREHCYNRIPESVQRMYRLDAGRLMLAEWEAGGVSDERLFEIVNHLNAGREWIEGEAERMRLAKLNLQAGLKAKNATAYPSAVEYLLTGINCLHDRSWTEAYDLAFALHLNFMEAEYLSGSFEQAEKWFTFLLGKAKTSVQRVDVYNVMVIMCTHRGLHETAVQIGMEGIESFGIRLPLRARQLHVIKGLLSTRKNWAKIPAQSMLDLPTMTRAESKALVRLMMNVGTPCYFINPNLYLLLLLKIVELSLKYGNTAESANAFNALGLLLGSGLGQYAQGQAYGLLGLELNERYPSKMLESKVNFTFGAFINHWTKHIETSIPYLWRSYQAGVESGDLVFASYAVTYIMLMLDYKGVRLEELRDFIANHQPFVRRTKSWDTAYMMELLDWVACNLESPEEPSFLFEADEHREKERVGLLQKLLNQVILQVFHMKKAMLYYLFGRYEDALASAEESRKLVGASYGLFHMPEHEYYEGLILTELYTHASASARIGYARRLRGIRRKLKRWAKHAPDNYAHLHALIEAEWNRLRGRDRLAVDAYERSIAMAGKGGFKQFEAIACERASLYYIGTGRFRLAREAMNEALQAYSRWGARAKAMQLLRTYPHLVAASEPDREPTTVTDTNTYSSPGLDLTAIIRSSQMISGEIVLDRLLQKLMVVVMQIAGAERGLLVLKENDGLYIEAEASASGMAGGAGSAAGAASDGPTGGGAAGSAVGAGQSDVAGQSESVSVLMSRPLEQETEIPKSLLHYTLRTMEPVTLDQAAAEGLFTGDPYVKRVELKSACCVPVVHQGHVIALLYLENNLSTHVFTVDRRSLIGIMTAQAAISIRNAKLYLEMEERVKERTEEIIRMEESRRQLFANISHDLGTPLTSIQGYVEAILDGVVEEPEARNKYLKIVLARVQGIRRLIKDLFQLSKMETRQLQFNRKTCAPGELIRDLFQKHELETADAGIGYRLAVEDRLAYVQVLADEQRVGQIYDNLLYNALRYTQRGGQIEVSAGLQPDGQFVLFRIADSGCGIAEEDLPHIFERFYRGSKSRSSTDGGGSGLGLAIAKEIATLHGGEIWAESVLGQGSVFYFTLPVQRLPG